MASRAREKMPKDYNSYCLVAAHLVRNAHRYYSEEQRNQIKKEEEECTITDMSPENKCKEINQRLRVIRTLKRQNRFREQQEEVQKMKKLFGSYRDLASVSGVALKTLHGWCAMPKERQHKGTSKSLLRKEEFTNFLMQDTISYSHPCKRYSGKRFLLFTWADIYKRYQESDFHKHGLISKTTMRLYKPKYILLSGATPANQCLCDICENCELLRKSLLAAGVKNIPPNKYACVDATLCEIRHGKFGTSSYFPPIDCIDRNCSECGKHKLRQVIQDNNVELLNLNRRVTWHRWQTVEGRSVPKKLEVRGTLKAAVNEFLELIESISDHLFRANWHRNVFQYIKAHLQLGYLLQVMDFTMNFSNRYQDEVQSAYYSATQTTIHGTVNFFKCQNSVECNEIVTLALVHISADLKHDSILSRTAMNMTFKYLIDIGIPLELVIQFCNNCASQYKSRRPFVEIARCAFNLIRVYLGEKHGKCYADGLFGRLKAWMSHKIKSRQFVITSAFDFFKHCREFYQTPIIKGSCQHYRVEFEFMTPSDIRRHQDSDLDQAVPQTHQIYSVRNTTEPLKLKVRHVPCLCMPCITEEGDCLNSSHTDPWREVQLIPERGANLRKYQKRKLPQPRRNRERKMEKEQENTERSECISYNEDQEVKGISYSGDAEQQQQERISFNENENDVEAIIIDSSDGELPDIVIEEKLEKRVQAKKNKKNRSNIEKNKKPSEGKNAQESVTDTVTDTACTWMADGEEMNNEEFANIPSSQLNEEMEIIEICERGSKEFKMCADNMISSITSADLSELSELNRSDMADIPHSILWPSLLSGFQSCTDYNQLETMVNDLKDKIPSLSPRENSSFCPEKDTIDDVAQKEIPKDGPTHLTAVWTIGDGNCLCRALSKAYFNDDSKHIKLRVCMVMEGIINRDKYLSDDCLERGASWVHHNADLPTVFTTFSEFFTPGQKMTPDTIQCIYCLEVYSCSRMNTYMGLWQLAQSASVLQVPIHTIYPQRGDSTLRNDFHRIFFPVQQHYGTTNDEEPIVIMWTGLSKGAVPIHFVPLLPEVQ